MGIHIIIDVERELNFLNLIVVCSRDAIKMPVSFVTHCGVSDFLSTVLRFSFLRSSCV